MRRRREEEELRAELEGDRGRCRVCGGKLAGHEDIELVTCAKLYSAYCSATLASPPGLTNLRSAMGVLVAHGG